MKQHVLESNYLIDPLPNSLLFLKNLKVYI